MGFKAFLDENKYIVGLAPTMLVDQARYEAQIYGESTSVVLNWEVKPGDQISEISGSFTDQGYLAQITLKTWRGDTGIFGYP